jgi:ABC-2 type transport system ATP-binding protein
MIELENVTRTYGPTVAVDSLSLTVAPGEVFAFLGPNGAGKTTTIKMMVGLLRPTRGHVRLCGFDVTRDPRESSRRVGYVPDQPYLYDKLSGRELLHFVGRMYGMSDTDVAARIDVMTETFELADFIDRLTESYSHGMKQRTVFASALLHRPEVFVVDEPMVGLDPHSVRLVKDLLKAQASDGACVFMSTHTLSMAEEIADRIGIVDHGKLRFLGTVTELEEKLAAKNSSLEHLFLELTRSSNGWPDETAAKTVPEKRS